MKKILIPFATLALAAIAPAQIKQIWLNTLTDPNGDYKAGGVAIAPDGVTYTASQYNATRCRVSAYDGNGSRTWSVQIPILDARYFEIACDANGTPYVAITPDDSNEAYVLRLDRTDGSIDWNSPIQNVKKIYELQIDPTGNPVVAFFSEADNCVNVRKISSEGQPLFTTSSGTPFYYPNSLRIAANGQIYVGLSDQKKFNAIWALTPNGTPRFGRSWANQGGISPSFYAMPSTVLTDRNGRAFAIEADGTYYDKLHVRTFESDGTFILQKLTMTTLYNLRAGIDADNRIVVATVGNQGGVSTINVDWLSTSATGVAPVATSQALMPPNASVGLSDVICDAFGQAYVYGRVGVTLGYKSRVWAFDSLKDKAVWAFNDLGYTTVNDPTYCAISRWGQVSLNHTVTGTKLGDGVLGIKQMGFRNLLINGQTHTGGRTISGTANFYSSSSADRDVPLTSNTPYAVVVPKTTVVAGQSQSTFTVDLKPTAVRRAVRIQGTFDGTERSVVFYLEPPTVSSLALYPTTVQGGKNANATARINGDAPEGGMTVSLTSSHSAAIVPASVAIAEGDVTKTFLVKTSPVSQQVTATLSAKTGSTTKTATLTITP